MLILRAQFHYFQKGGACINDPVWKYYNFFHFPTPIEMEIDAKMDLAKTILLETKPSLEEVAERLGYKSTQHFILQFKAATGMPPVRIAKNR